MEYGQDARNRWRRRAPWGLALGLLGFLAALALLPGASASSYSGSGAWTIPPGTNETVVGESIAVNGMVYVMGNLTLVNSTLRCYGAVDLVMPPLVLNEVSVTGNLSMENSTLTVDGNVTVRGQMEARNSTVNIRGNLTPPLPPPTLGRLNVFGNLSLTHTVLNFTVPVGALQNITGLTGLRVGAAGRVLLQDLDNQSATPDDASLLTATTAGSYSVFQPGSSLTILNSVAEHLGWDGYPGLELNGSVVWIEGATFRDSNLSVAVNGCAGVRIADAYLFNISEAFRIRNCSGVELLRSAFENVTLPWNATGGYGYRIDQVSVIGHSVGLLFRNISAINITSFAADFPGFPPEYFGWAPRGTALGFDNGANVTLSGVSVNGTFGPGGTPPARFLWAHNISAFSISAVEANAVDAVGEINGSVVLTITELRGAGVGGGLRIANARNVTLWSLAIAGSAPYGLAIAGCWAVDLRSIDVDARIGIDIEASNDVTLHDANINATLWGLLYYEGTRLTAAQFAITSTVSGIELVNSSIVNLDDFSVSFGAIGLQAAYADGTWVTNANFTTPVGTLADQWLRALNVDTLHITDVNYAGACDVAGTVDGAIFLILDRVNAASCGKGLSVSTAAFVIVRAVSLAGAWNGSALGLFGVTNGLIEDCDLTGAGDDALLIAASYQIRVERVNGSRAGAGGVFVVLSGDIELLNSTFVGSGGTALSIVNATGPTRLYRLIVAGHFSGIEVMGSPDVSIQDVESSSNGIDGAFFDSFSLRASLRNLTLSRNGRNGLSMDAPGATFVDGNLSLNGGDAIATAPGIKMAWVVEVYASITDDDMRLTGDLDVRPGAWFWATRASIHVDAQTPAAMPSGPPPGLLFGARSYVFFDHVQLDAVNESVPYAITIDDGELFSIESSTLTGAASDDAGSAIRATSSSANKDQTTVAIFRSKITGFYQPMDVRGGVVDVRVTNFTANAFGPRLEVLNLLLDNVTCELSGDDGLTVISPIVSVDHLFLLNNQGVGGRFLDSRVYASVIEARGNLKGGLYMSGESFYGTGLRIESNVLFGIRVEDGLRVELTDLWMSGNTGSALVALGIDRLTLTNASLRGGGGRGLDFDSINRATVTGGDVSNQGGFGLMANNVTNLTIYGTRFDANAVAHMQFLGDTVAWVTNATLANSPGDAVLVAGNARATLVDVQGNTAFGRVYAIDSSYAYLLNSTLAPPRADDLAQVDVAWNVRVRVLLQSGGPAEGAVVDVRDALRALVATHTADATGTTPLFALLAKSVFASPRVDSFTPHAFTAQFVGPGSARSQVTVDRYMLVTLGFDDVVPVSSLTLDGIEGENGWYLSAVTAFLEAVDEGGYGVTLYWRLDGSSVWQSAGSGVNFSSTLFSIDKEGDTALEFYAVDGMGNFEPHQTVVVRIDAADPTVRFEGVPAVVTEPDFEVRWSSFDGGGSGVQSYLVEVAKDGGPFTPWLNATANTSAPFHGEDGHYQFRVSATDAAGRAASPATNSTEVALFGTVHLRVTDQDGRPIFDAKVSAVGGNVTALGTGEFSIRFAPGPHAVQVTARDYYSRNVMFNVSAHNTTEAGDVMLVRVPPVETTQEVSGLLIGFIIVAIVAAVTALAIVRSRRKRAPPPK